MSKLTTESSNNQEFSVELLSEIRSYWKKNIVKSWALMAIEEDEEEEREREEESRKRFEVQIEERRRLYALGLYELEEGEILE